MTSDEEIVEGSRGEVGRPPSSFLTRLPDVENVYELVVVAAQRARQLNLASRILPPENGVKPVEKALNEALAKTIKYEILDIVEKEES